MFLSNLSHVQECSFFFDEKSRGWNRVWFLGFELQTIKHSGLNWVDCSVYEQISKFCNIFRAFGVLYIVIFHVEIIRRPIYMAPNTHYCGNWVYYGPKSGGHTSIWSRSGLAPQTGLDSTFYFHLWNKLNVLLHQSILSDTWLYIKM